MSVTVLYEDSAASADAAEVAGDALWLSPVELLRVSGWEIKPEGVCRGEVCVPVPADRAQELVRAGAGGSWLNLTGFARYIEQPYARDEAGAAWYFAAPAAERRDGLLLRAAAVGVARAQGAAGAVGVVVRLPLRPAGLAGAAHGARRAGLRGRDGGVRDEGARGGGAVDRGGEPGAPVAHRHAARGGGALQHAQRAGGVLDR
jgi:hypothetical protein